MEVVKIVSGITSRAPLHCNYFTKFTSLELFHQNNFIITASPEINYEKPF